MRNRKGDAQGLPAQNIPVPIWKIRELEADDRGRSPGDMGGEGVLSFCPAEVQMPIRHPRQGGR